MVEELSAKKPFLFAPPGQRELFLRRLSSWIRCDWEQQYEFLWRWELAFLTGGTDSRGWDGWLSYPRSKYEDERWSNWGHLALDVHDVWGHWRGSALPIGGLGLHLCVLSVVLAVFSQHALCHLPVYRSWFSHRKGTQQTLSCGAHGLKLSCSMG